MRKSVLGVLLIAFAAVVSLALASFSGSAPGPVAAKATSSCLSADTDEDVTDAEMTPVLRGGPVQDIPCQPGSCIDPAIPNLACRQFNDGCHCSTAKNRPLCAP